MLETYKLEEAFNGPKSNITYLNDQKCSCMTNIKEKFENSNFPETYYKNNKQFPLEKWINGKIYEKKDQVIFNNKIYIALHPTPNVKNYFPDKNNFIWKEIN